MTMIDERYKRRTIRLSPFVDEELLAIANKNNISVNKLVSEIIMYHINELDRINNVSNVATILNSLENLQNNINDLQKKCNWLNTLTKQIFINSGFARNRDEREDSTFQDFVDKKYKNKYEKNYNA